MPEVRIRQHSKVRWKTNVLSGHQWREETLVEFYDIVGPAGVCASTHSYSRAVDLQKEWQEFYDKYWSPHDS